MGDLRLILAALFVAFPAAAQESARFEATPEMYLVGERIRLCSNAVALRDAAIILEAPVEVTGTPRETNRGASFDDDLRHAFFDLNADGDPSQTMLIVSHDPRFSPFETPEDARRIAGCLVWLTPVASENRQIIVNWIIGVMDEFRRVVQPFEVTDYDVGHGQISARGRLLACRNDGTALRLSVNTYEGFGLQSVEFHDEPTQPGEVPCDA
ncbi:hypothetical protein [Hasllibacter sp. MH4015]|uniref:hypothetical protein n=1 Tax=Hasllibacter sp. MH4015 TaxID=2854029 RepID=UPI001CD75FF5|nr:hypothetical protein [Hasllibacter sp. MH4015]